MLSKFYSKLTVFVFLLCFTASLVAKGKNEYLPEWKEGYLDIHQIATGRGNAAIAILPDGTTMLIDAGDLGDRVNSPQEIMPALPNDSKLPGEWIAVYVKHFTKGLKRDGKLDYAFMTHYDTDHMGGVAKSAIKIEGRNYVLNGIAEVAEHLTISKLIDRGYPDYDYPSKAALKKSKPYLDNYFNFIDYQVNERSTQVEMFKVGTAKQFELQYKPEKFKNFEVRNIYSRGDVWAGEGDKIRHLVPPIDSLEEKDYPNENMCSSVIKMSYGDFSYYTGGDITGMVQSNQPQWKDLETQVGRVVGPVNIAVLNHHGYSDSMNPNFISSLRPNAFIAPVWDFYHPQPETLERLVDKTLYPEDRYVFATGLVSGNKKRMGALAENIQPYGHIVTRVYNGGTKFQIFVLDAHSLDYKVISKTEVMDAK